MYKNSSSNDTSKCLIGQNRCYFLAILNHSVHVFILGYLLLYSFTTYGDKWRTGFVNMKALTIKIHLFVGHLYCCLKFLIFNCKDIDSGAPYNFWVGTQITQFNQIQKVEVQNSDTFCFIRCCKLMAGIVFGGASLRLLVLPFSDEVAFKLSSSMYERMLSRYEPHVSRSVLQRQIRGLRRCKRV